MGLQPKPDQFAPLERQLRLFAEQKPISIRSALKLAQMMAAKAAIIKDEVGIALRDDPHCRSGLGGQFKSFKANLLPALEPDEFADIYAETITYGMFAARFHDDSLATFSRAEALEKLPASNPFLKGLFEYVAGPALPKRLGYIVDDLVQLMRASDPHSLFEGYGRFTARNDPFVHFYEDFLAAYNPKKRKSRGVWYTPEPVVDFIVRAVDDVLKTEFGLADGLADTGKVTVDWDTGANDPKTGKPVTVKKEVHKVQILDPATGTGTFLAKAVQLIADRVKARAPGKWSGYVEQDLLPRLHGFELLMASYAMCHMKLDMQLTQSGYKPSAKPPVGWTGTSQWPPRLSVWLTNALEPAERDIRDLFFQPLAEEARGASEVKRQSPIMCVIGNPPYSGESANKGAHIMALMEAYKKEPGGKEKLKERNPKWINDDYVKFIRMAEDLIAKNPSGGVLGFITNHGYIDNPTFRGMRWQLQQSFDRIYILDLHGNSKKRETSPDGTPDKNVFDILPGVAIVIAVKRSDDHALAAVRHGDLWGSRSSKGDALWNGTLGTLVTRPLAPAAPMNFFAQSGARLEAEYRAGFSVSDLMPLSSVGVITARDSLTVDENKQVLWGRVQNFASSEKDDEIRARFNLGVDVQDWSVANAKVDLRAHLSAENVTRFAYRPFDNRWTYYTGISRGFICRPRAEVMRHMRKDNLALVIGRQGQVVGKDQWSLSWMTDSINDFNLFYRGGGVVFPLLLYPPDKDQPDVFASAKRSHNLDPTLYAAICTAAGIDPADQAGPDDDFRAATGDARPSEVKVFDYIYGVLHAPNYRATFAEFLKIDFPRIPYPPSPAVFAQVSGKGEQLRRLHLMEPAAIGATPYPYTGDGDDVVASGYPKWAAADAQPLVPPGLTRRPASPADAAGSGTPARGRGDGTGRVLINATQGFDAVPPVAWSFPIGGYLPAQKWLKDRRGRALGFDDITHYQRIVKILVETDRIMREIDLPLD